MCDYSKHKSLFSKLGLPFCRHYYIAVGGDRKNRHNSGSSSGKSGGGRTSSRFRREAYTLRNLTLVAYIGDEREALTSVLPSASAVAPSSNASTPSILNASNKPFNSMPR